MTDMTLYASPASPYARKTRVVADELGLTPRIKVVAAQPRTDTAFHAVNPARRIPALQLASGRVLVDSRVICEYFDDLAGGSELFPRAGEARWESLTLHALGDGIADWAVPLRNETLRPAAQQSPDFIERARASILGIVHDVAQRIDARSSLSVGTLSVACALDYLNFRFASQGAGDTQGIDWQSGHKSLAAWLADVSARQSMKMSDPRLG